MGLEDKKSCAGNTYNRLLIKAVYSNKGIIFGTCYCSCGNTKDIRLDSILSGKVKSCGCLKKELDVSTKTKHGMYGTVEYLCWQRMKSRCQEHNKEAYPHHAGKGIKVCDMWMGSFENFYKDMGECPEGYTLDRINNQLDYTPTNTRWVSKSLQLFNRELGKIAGVNFRKDRNKWVVTICKDYVIYRLGSYVSYEEAVMVRLEAEQRLFGEFSAKNFMVDGDMHKILLTTKEIDNV